MRKTSLTERKVILVEYKTLYNDVKNILSEKRFKHSEGVVQRALEYAQIYGVDSEVVKLVAIAHDIAKELTKDQEKEHINKYNIVLDEVEAVNHNLLHAKIGACICKEKYAFTEDMVNAIRFHTTGRPNMSLLEKIIYLADATDPGRRYNSIDYYVGLVRDNIDKGMCEVTKWVINHLLENNKVIHLDSVRCYNYYNNI